MGRQTTAEGLRQLDFCIPYQGRFWQRQIPLRQLAGIRERLVASTLIYYTEATAVWPFQIELCAEIFRLKLHSDKQFSIFVAAGPSLVGSIVQL